MATEKRPPRPSWDQYFMDIAHVAASRSNCCRRGECEASSSR